MSNFTSIYVEHFLDQNEGHVRQRNRNLANPCEAYNHLLSTTISTIKSTISMVSDSNLSAKNYVEYLTIMNKEKENMINNIVEDNKYNATFITPVFNDLDKNSNESKYFQFAKSTYNKVQAGKLPMMNLNEDALLAYNLYRIVDTVTKTAFAWDKETKEISLNEESKFVSDFLETYSDSDPINED